MDARRARAALVAVSLVVLMGAGYKTPNFVIQTADARLAEQFGKAAEAFRHDLAVEWLGQPMPDWSAPCTVTVQVGAHLGPGGATTFLFDRGEVYGWRMNIQGSAERLLDSVLPHEITHMVFASHFRAPLPRWADEGGATSVEHVSEKNKHKQMLVQFLRTNRGIAFNQMFAMTEYPADVMPLYAQAYSLAEYLISLGGRRRYIEYLDEAMRTNQWGEATNRFYGISDLGSLQNVWLAWVAQGFPPIAPSGGPAATLVAQQRRPRPEPNLIYRVSGKDQSATASPIAVEAPPSSVVVPVGAVATATPIPGSEQDWRHAGDAATPAPVAAMATADQPVRAQVTRPQPIEQPRQTVILQGP